MLARYFFFSLLIFLSHYVYAIEMAAVFLESRESDPASIIENVSTIHGNYTEIEVDLVVPAPDSLILSRLYSSSDTFQQTNLGGWRFYPHCYLKIEKDLRTKGYTTKEGLFEKALVSVGTSEGTILTYEGWKHPSSHKKSLFKIDPAGYSKGIANTTKANLSSWSNLKNNRLYFNPKDACFELELSTGTKRFYQHYNDNVYLLFLEILPSGNRIFYEFDEKGRIILINETNANEEKVLAWIKIQYGQTVDIETSDGKKATYYFKGDAGKEFLYKVVRSEKPTLYYHYQPVKDHLLLIRKELPEGRFVKIEYYSAPYKVKSVATPLIGATTFIYKKDHTEVHSAGNRHAIYRFDHDIQLTAIEQYLEGSLYRVDKKYWGKKKKLGNLTATTVEDGIGNVYYYHSFAYDDKENVIVEKEYGNLTGGDRNPLLVTDEGVVSDHVAHTKRYLCTYGEEKDEIIRQDEKRNGIEFIYKKGTSILIRKSCLQAGIRKKRWFYHYNDEGTLIRVQTDDGYSDDPESLANVDQRLVTTIIPKQDLPFVGAPEIIEERCFDGKNNKEVLLKRTINRFDNQGNIIRQEIYDANEEYRYCIEKTYENGLVLSESDPIGNETYYSYDANRNLIAQKSPSSGLIEEYSYDLQNRLVSFIQYGITGEKLSTTTCYDVSGNKSEEFDHFGNRTIYCYDSLGRVIRITYPQTNDQKETNYSYTYDLFNHETSITNPKEEVIQKLYTVHGKPTEIHYPDGTRELFKYDPEGSLHRHCDRQGQVKIFEYDYLGRVVHIERYGRSNSSSGEYDGSLYYTYDAFNKLSEENEEGLETTYIYDYAGRLAALLESPNGGCKKRKTEYTYDSLGRTQVVKSHGSLQIKEYDLLDRVLEERIENKKGEILLRKCYNYHPNGQIECIIGYPHNQASTLIRYEYDGIGRVTKVWDALGNASQIQYNDHYINSLGQRVLQRTSMDPFGTCVNEIFDASGNLVKVIQRDKNNKLLAEREFIYDAIDNLLLDRNSQYAISHTYNEGTQLSTIARGCNPSEEQKCIFEYNSWGELIKKKSGDLATLYNYNLRGRLESISCNNPLNQEETLYELFYDRLGNITNITLDSYDLITCKFNNQSRLLSETFQDKWGSYEIKCSYDPEGLVQRLQLPDGSYIKYNYEGPFVKSIMRQPKNQDSYEYEVVERDQMGHILEETLIHYAGIQKYEWDRAGKRNAIINNFFQDHGERNALQFFKKREVTIAEDKNEIYYDYNSLYALISENEHKYNYDALYNRLKKDYISYKINGLNQIVEEGDVTYSYDANGNLASKNIDGGRWNYCFDSLSHLVQIKDPDQTIITYTYDPFGRRLTKRIESKGKKTKNYRYFYLGETEIGCLDEKGEIIELKVLSDPQHPESTPAIAFEIDKEVYVPIYDLQGNVVCLVDGERRRIVEHYNYSAFGEEEIHDENGESVSDSVLGNKWRYQSKRIDKETGLIYFGKRYYDPSIGRWISQDPLGEIDCPNLYAYVRNNPIAFVDYFGLSSEINEQDPFLNYFYGEYEPHCYCEHHRDCKRGGDIGSALGGMTHGVADFALHFFQDLHMSATYIGSAELELAYYEKELMIAAIERLHFRQKEWLGNFVMDHLFIDHSDAIYQSFRNKTTIGLEVAYLLAGGYGVAKSVLSFNSFRTMPSKILKMNRFFRSLGTEPSASSSLNSLRLKNSLISREIAAGHAFEKHILINKEFAGIRTRTQFARHIEYVLNNPSKIKELRNGRMAYWHQETGTVIIRNPLALDGGTAFQPLEGMIYFEKGLR